MRLVKPFTLEVVTAFTDERAASDLVVSTMLGLDLDSVISPMKDQDIWALLHAHVPPHRPIDLWLPKSHGEYAIFGHMQSSIPINTGYLRVRCGDLTKDVTVFGDRVWEPGLFGWKPSEPEPFQRMPLTWSRTFGGEACRHYPLGVGADALSRLKSDLRANLPNLMVPGEVPWGPNQTLTPVCFETGYPEWFSSDLGGGDVRRNDGACFGRSRDTKRIGSCLVPHDQSQSRYWRPGDVVNLEGFQGDIPIINWSIPSVAVRCVALRHDRTIDSVASDLDTLLLFPDEGRVILVFRALLENVGTDARLLSTLIVGAEDPEAPKAHDHYIAVESYMREGVQRANPEILNVSLMPKGWVRPAMVRSSSLVSLDDLSPLAPRQSDTSLEGGAVSSGNAAHLVASIDEVPFAKFDDASEEGLIATVAEEQPNLESSNLSYGADGDLCARGGDLPAALVLVFKSFSQTLASQIEMPLDEMVFDLIRKLAVENGVEEIMPILGRTNEIKNAVSALPDTLETRSVLARELMNLAEDIENYDAAIDAIKSGLKNDDGFRTNFFQNPFDGTIGNAFSKALDEKRLGLSADFLNALDLDLIREHLQGYFESTAPMLGQLATNIFTAISSPQSSDADLTGSVMSEYGNSIRLLEHELRSNAEDQAISWFKTGQDPAATGGVLQELKALIDLPHAENTLNAPFTYQEATELSDPTSRWLKDSFSKLLNETDIDNALRAFSEQAEIGVSGGGDDESLSFANILKTLTSNIVETQFADEHFEEGAENITHEITKTSVSDSNFGKNVKVENTVQESVKSQGELHPLLHGDLLAVGVMAEPRRLARALGAQVGEAMPENARQLGILLAEKLRSGIDVSGLDCAGADLCNANLRGLNFQGVYLEGADLSGADLREANFEDAVMVGAILTKARMNSASFKGCNMSGVFAHSSDCSNADFTDAELYKGDFTESNFTNAIFDNINAEKAILVKADLSNTRCSKGDFSRTVLENALLDSCSWNGVSLGGANVTGCRANNAHFINCKFNATFGHYFSINNSCIERCHFLDADLPGLDASTLKGERVAWFGAKLDGARFLRADLAGAIFTEASLYRATFNHSDLRGIGMNAANLVESHFEGCQLLGAQLRAAQASRASFRHAVLRLADLTGAVLDGCDFTDADLAHTILEQSNNG